MQKSNSLRWNKRQVVLNALHVVFSVTLSYFVLLSVLISAFGGMFAKQGTTVAAASCSIPAVLSTSLEITPNAADNIIDCSAQDITITATGRLVLKNFVTSDTSITNDGGVVLKVRNLTIDVGGEISATGQGYTASSGEIANAVVSTGVAAGSGGGNGGAGGSGNTAGGAGNVVGETGSVIGVKDSPLTLGGAGGTSGGAGLGGNGGGALKIEASQTVTVNGNVVSDGLDGAKSADNQTAGGGGAGGSIWIEADTLAGNGVVSAKGAGTDVTASILGGGGGGGRIMMVCTTATTFAGTVSVAAGQGSQNGQVGTLVGPGCRPHTPQVLKFYETASASYVNRELAVGDITAKTALTFAANLDASNLKLEIEIREKAQAFQNVPTGAQVLLASNKACTGVPTTNGVKIDDYCGHVEISNILVSKEYKWQARIIDSSGVSSLWVQYGANTVNDTDFIVAGAPTSLIIIEGNNQTGTVGQKLPINPRVRLTDIAGYGVPFYGGFSWPVTGGGTTANAQVTTDKLGEMAAEWTLGNVAGINNNTLRAERAASPSFSVTFTASAVPGIIDHYLVQAPNTLSLVGQPFTYTVTAKDVYGNTAPFTGNLAVSPVQANDTSANALGTLAPDSITISDLASGTITVNGATHSYSENIKVKVLDANGKLGYSNAILMVNSVGSCPAITIDVDQTWNAVDAPGGVFDCRNLGTFTVTPGITLTLKSYDNGDSNWSNDFGVTILADSFNVTATGIISANGQGYDGARGPGAGQSATYDGYGGAHGGYGDAGAVPYGNVFEPTAFGSSGGNSGPFCNAGSGGGAIKLVSSGAFTNNGTISANGGPDDCQNGAGGSVWIDATTLAGTTGVITANGRITTGHGGSGGRVAIYYTNNTNYRLNNAGLNAFGYGAAGAGTVYVEQKGVNTTHNGILLVDNEGRNANNAGLVEGAYSFSQVRLTRYGHVEVMGNGSVITVNDGSGLTGDDTKPKMTVIGTFDYTGTGVLKLDGVDLGLKGKVTGVTDFEVGGTNAAGVTLYAKTWWYNKTVVHSFDDILVKGNGILSAVSYDGTDADDYGVNLTAASLTVESGGIVTATGNGYAGATGTGAGASATYDGYGASHGGHSEQSRKAYGSVYEPTTLGSGGGNSGPFCNGAPGGGALKLTITGTLANDGSIESGGAVVACNNGAGGSLWIDTNIITGAGVVKTNGATHSGHGGAGGRIAIYYATNNGFNLNTTGVKSYGYGASGAGTIYLEQKGVDSAKNGTLLVDNEGRNASSAGLIEDVYSFKLVQLTRYGHLEVMGQDSVITISDGAGMQGDNTKPKMTVTGTFNYTGTGVLKLDGVDIGINGKITGVTDVEIGGTNAAGVTLYANTWWYNKTFTHAFGNMVVKGNGVLSTVGYDGATTDDYGVVLGLTSLNVEAGGLITATGLGYAPTAGPGGGHSATYDGYGASHGGHSEVSRMAYGSAYEPVTFGSGGGNSGPFCGGGAGGGAVKLVIANSFVNNGTIASNGAPAGCNNGAGGSIWIDTNTIAGTGLVTTNGATHSGHGGAGGRIAVYYSTNTNYNLNSTGIRAFGYGPSGAGTIYLEQKGVDSPKNGTLLIDNEGRNANSAGLVEDIYSFKLVKLTRYGHVEVMGQNSVITISDGAGMQGDNTKPKMTVTGTFDYTGTGVLKLDGVDLGINGKVTGVSDFEIGGTNAAGVTLYANTWWYNKTVTHTFGNMTVKGNGTLTTVSYDGTATNDFGVTLNLTGLTVEPNGVVTATGNGYAGATGPGAGASATYDGYGASHGGHSEISRMAYGSVYEPTTLGSGGGNSGPFCGGPSGGGAIKLVISGTLLNNGSIVSNGGPWGCNNASGGSIWINTNEIAGTTGVVAVNGGTHGGHGGAGGRIAVYYSTNTDYRLNPSGLTAFGYGASGAGTVYLEQKGVDIERSGTLLVDNAGRNANSAGLTQDSYNFKLVKLTRYGHVEVMGQDSVITISDGAGMQGDNTKPKMTVSGTFNYTGTGILKLDGVDLGLNGKVTGVTDVEIGGTNAAGVTLYAKTWWYNKSVTPEFSNVTVKGNGILTFVSYDGSGNDDYGPSLALNSLNIEANGVLTATGQGYTATLGPGGGASATYDGYGASHGGFYTPILRAPYGDLYQPTTLGSGGGNSGPFCGGGSGGGAIKLVLTGTLTNEGTIVTNGAPAGCNNGAGGSVWIDTNTISGSGTIVANGAMGGHAGAGGRIAVYYSTNSNALLDKTHITALGGNEAGPGTVYLEHKGVHRVGGGDLILNNNGRAGRAQDLEAKTYLFNDFYVGTNINLTVKSDTAALNEGATVAVPHNIVPDTSLVGAWGMEEATNNTFTDASSNHRDGSLRDNTVTVPGKFGQGVQVQGTAQGIVLSNPVTLPTAYTIDSWVKFPLPATADGWRTLIHVNGVSNHQIIVHSGGQLGVYNNGWYDSGYNVNSLTGWHHLASVATASSTKFYIDGALVGTSGTAIFNAINVLGNAGYSQQFGTFDALRITDFAMTATQVATAAAATEAPVADSHTLGLWQFEDQVFTTKDTSIAGTYTAHNQGLPIDIVPGKYGKARNFYQSNTLKFTPINLSGNWTIDTWVKFPLPTTAGGWRSIIVKDIGNYHPIMVSSAGDLGLYANGFYNTGYNLNATPAGWHHVAIVAGGTTTKFYLDGAQAGATINVNPATQVAYIGNYVDYPYYQAGAIDAMRISNRSFTAEELLATATSDQAPVADDSTIALWQFDEEKVSAITDVSSKNLTATAKGTVSTAGKIGNARGFSGIEDSLTLPATTFNFSGGLTIAYWAKHTGYNNSERIIDFGNACTSDSIYLYRSGTSSSLNFQTMLGSNGSMTDFGVNGAIINDEWHHYAVTLDAAGNAKIYRDGVLLGTRTGFTIPATVARQYNYIGRSCSTAEFFKGELDEMAIFNRALSGEEIKANAAGYTLSEYQAKQQQLTGKGVELDLTGNFTLESGAVISGNGVGFASDNGMGRGGIGVGYSGGGGGSNGGDGGAGQSDGQNQQAPGGRKYGDQLVPVTLGSGGGSSAVGAAGGVGGGSLSVVAHGVVNEQGTYVNGNITIAGTISMNGTAGKTGSPGGGGGAGGSILLHGNTCSVTGTLTATGGEGGNSDVDGGSGGGGRVSVLYNVGPCTVSGTVNVTEGTPTDSANYSAQVGQIGTYPDEPSSVPWPSQYREQFELKETPQGQLNVQPQRVASLGASVLGISESVIPIGGIINGTTVTLKADAYDAGARPIAPKRLKIQIELKKINEPFTGTTNLNDSGIVTFSGGAPAVLSVTINNLDMGASYKWRVRTVNVDNNLYSEWQEFGDNASNVADFTITTVSVLELSVGKSPIDLSETTSLTVVAKNDLGFTDTTYRGTVTFRSTSGTAQLPANYTFVAGDNGQHTFTGVKLFETGTFTITAEDTINPVLVDTATIVVNEPRIPFLSIGASRLEIIQGEAVTLSWSSNFVTNVSIDNGVGSVSANDSRDVTPDTTTTYTITGQNEQGETLTSSVTINVIPARRLTSVRLEAIRSSIYITEVTSLRVTLLDDQGNTFTNYRGTVTFTSSSGTAQLPNDYTYVAGDNGRHTFSNVKFFELGTFDVRVQDIDNTSITATTQIAVSEPPRVPYLTIGASRLSIVKGESVNITWASHYITGMAINQNIGAVGSNGTRKVTPSQTSTYSISGKNEQGQTVTSSVTITVTIPEVHTPVLSITPSKTKVNKGETVSLAWSSKYVTGLTIDQKIGTVAKSGARFVTPLTTTTYTISGYNEQNKKMTASATITVSQTTLSCPVIEVFTVSDSLIKKSNEFEITWKVSNADTVAIDAFGSGLPLFGKVQLALTKPQDITILASKAGCQRKVTRHIEVVSTYPWEGAGSMLIGVIALETAAMQLGFSQGNIWFALMGFIDRTKKRRPWGIVYDSVTKKLISRVIVRLWDAVNGKLVDTVVTDANGIFKLTPKKGEYIIKVVHANYKFPSELVAGNTDTGYTNVYKGEVIEVMNDNDQLMVSVPMDPEKRTTQSVALRNIFSWLEEFVSLASPIMLVIGFVYSVVVTVMYPLMLNYLVLALYIILLLVKITIYLTRPKMFGMVTSVDGKLISGLEIGLYDKEFNNLVARTFTNKKGAYNFVVKNQDYLLQVMDSKYKLLHRNATKDGLLIKKSTENSGVRLISESLMVYEAGTRKGA